MALKEEAAAKALGEEAAAINAAEEAATIKAAAEEEAAKALEEEVLNEETPVEEVLTEEAPVEEPTCTNGVDWTGALCIVQERYEQQETEDVLVQDSEDVDEVEQETEEPQTATEESGGLTLMDGPSAPESRIPAFPEDGSLKDSLVQDGVQDTFTEESTDMTQPDEFVNDPPGDFIEEEHLLECFSPQYINADGTACEDPPQEDAKPEKVRSIFGGWFGVDDEEEAVPFDEFEDPGEE
jgi:hypothetical protein